MNEMSFDFGEGTVRIEFDEGLYPKDAIYGASYVFIDRCYVRLDRVGDKRIEVMLRAKNAGADTQALAGEFQNELLGQAYRRQIFEENRNLVETIVTKALGGAAGPPGLDELLSTDIGEETAFDDPLGIAMSWEEKYKKKGGAAAKSEDGDGAEAGSTDAAAVPAEQEKTS